jgi:DNA-binding PadR family transcriptional regulator
MLELAILGFLRERSCHGYELKQQLSMLTGHFRPISDGSLYPAIARLERRGLIVRHAEPSSAGLPRQVLALTPEGEAELLRRLGRPAEVDITDRNRFFTLLAFLRYLPADAQQTILERRLAFLQRGRSFFSAAGKPVRFAEETDPFRQGMLHIARATSRVEQDWLSEMIVHLSGKLGEDT